MSSTSSVVANAYVRYTTVYVCSSICTYIYIGLCWNLFSCDMNRNRLCLFYIHFFNSHSHLVLCIIHLCSWGDAAEGVLLLWNHLHFPCSYIHTSQIHVCVSSICLYLPHRPHILDGTNRVLSCLLPCLFSTYGILCFKNVLHIVQYRQRVGVRQGACECERGRAKNSKALLQILCRIPLYNKEIRFSLEHICFSEYFPCIPIA